MSARAAAGFVLLALSTAAAIVPGCASLPEIPTGTCGNGVIETGEDCDTSAPSGSRCRTHDEALACRFDCTSGAKCPRGWVCGADDGVCRQPSGAYAATPLVIETPGDAVQLGDFDGDGAKEIMALTRPDELERQSARIHYLVNGVFSKNVSLPLGVAPAIGDANSDGIDDVALGEIETGGIDIFLGQSDRTLAPQAYARFAFPPGTIVRAVVLHGVTSGPFGQVPVLLLDADSSGLIPGTTGRVRILTQGKTSSSTFSVPLGLLSDSPANLASDPVPANFVESGSPCDELVVAYRDTYDLSMYTPCVGDALRTTTEAAPKKIVTLPAAVTKGVIAADVNADGHVDLIAGGASATWIAFGRGDGTFSATPDLVSSTTYTTLSCAGDFVSATCFPLAVQAPAATGTLDQLVAFPEGVTRLSKVSVSTGAIVVSVKALTEQRSGGWTIVRIGDVNADGIDDVVAASSTSPDVDFFTGSPTGLLNPAKIQTDLPVTLLAIGDYDGDLVADVGIVEHGVSSSALDGVDVAYGKRAGPPEPPARQGAFASIHQMSAARFNPLFDFDDIALTFGGADGDLISVLSGNGARQLLAPFGLVFSAGPSLVQGGPISMSFGAFGGSAPGLATLAFDETLDDSGFSIARLWLVPFHSGAQLDAALASPPVPDAVLVHAAEDATDANVFSALTRTGDLDGDGVDEAVALVQPAFGKGARGVIAISKVTTSDRGSLFAAATTIALPDAAAWTPIQGSDLRVVDVDGDGHKDVIVLSEGHRDRSWLGVLWNDGSGGFDASSATTISLVDGSSADQDRVTSITTLADPVGGWSLFSATKNAAFLVSPATGSPRDLSLRPIAGLEGGDAIAAGDVTGDGVPDLVLGTADRVLVHAGLPRSQ